MRRGAATSIDFFLLGGGGGVGGLVNVKIKRIFVISWKENGHSRVCSNTTLAQKVLQGIVISSTNVQDIIRIAGE